MLKATHGASAKYPQTQASCFQRKSGHTGHSEHQIAKTFSAEMKSPLTRLSLRFRAPLGGEPGNLTVSLGCQPRAWLTLGTTGSTLGATLSRQPGLRTRLPVRPRSCRLALGPGMDQGSAHTPRVPWLMGT